MDYFFYSLYTCDSIFNEISLTTNYLSKQRNLSINNLRTMTLDSLFFFIPQKTKEFSGCPRLFRRLMDIFRTIHDTCKTKRNP